MLVIALAACQHIQISRGPSARTPVHLSLSVPLNVSTSLPLFLPGGKQSPTSLVIFSNFYNTLADTDDFYVRRDPYYDYVRMTERALWYFYEVSNYFEDDKFIILSAGLFMALLWDVDSFFVNDDWKLNK